MSEPTTADGWGALIRERLRAAGGRAYPGQARDLARLRAAAMREDAAHYAAMADPADCPDADTLAMLAAVGERSEGLMAEMLGLDRVAWRNVEAAVKARGYALAAARWEAVAAGLTGGTEG